MTGIYVIAYLKNNTLTIFRYLLVFRCLSLELNLSLHLNMAHLKGGEGERRRKKKLKYENIKEYLSNYHS